MVLKLGFGHLDVQGRRVFWNAQVFLSVPLLHIHMLLHTHVTKVATKTREKPGLPGTLSGFAASWNECAHI